MTKQVSVPIAGKIVSIDVLVSDETRELDGKDYHLVKHDNAKGFRYLATSSALKTMDKLSEVSQNIMDELEETL